MYTTMWTKGNISTWEVSQTVYMHFVMHFVIWVFFPTFLSDVFEKQLQTGKRRYKKKKQKSERY